MSPAAPERPERLDFSPINDRPKLKLPNDARIALWVCPNIEHYEYLPDPVRIRDPWPRMPHPDVLGYGLKDYGNRVGLWRMFDVMDHFNVRCTTSLNLSVYEHYPEIMEACETRNWDVLCHGMYNTQYLWGLDEGDERAIIQDCVETYRRLTGRQLPGWFSPAASHTMNTPDLVAEAGIKYYSDWFHDDQPMPMNVRQGRLLTVPYSMELNDAVLHNRAQEADDFLVMVRDYFDTVYAEGADQPRIMCLALHPYMMGQPHRIGYLEKALDYILSHSGVWQATGEQIADWYYAEMWDQMTQHLDPALKCGRQP